MKFKRHSILAIVVSTILIISIITSFSVLLFDKVTSSTEENQFFLLESILKSRIHSSEDKVYQLGEMFAAMPKVKKYFAEGNREKLYNELKEVYKIQDEKYGIADAHFAVPPATSFLRMRDFEKFGDDLSYKPQVLSANAEKVSKKGEALSRTGPVFYAVLPISDTLGNHLGCVQVDLEFPAVLDKLKATYNIELSLFINEKMLTETSTKVGGEIINADNRMGAYIKFHSTNWDLMKNLLIEDDFSATDGIVDPFVREYAKTDYGIFMHPLKDFTVTC